MMRELKSAVKNIAAPAVYLMFYGVKAALGVMILGILAYQIYVVGQGGGYDAVSESIALVRAGFSLFVLFLLGGIIFDCVAKQRS